jgi:hypothetical protein
LRSNRRNNHFIKCWGIAVSESDKRGIIVTESALDVERAAMKETTPAAMPLLGFGTLLGQEYLEDKSINVTVQGGRRTIAKKGHQNLIN